MTQVYMKCLDVSQRSSNFRTKVPHFVLKEHAAVMQAQCR